MIATNRPRLSPAAMFNMSFGFLGIQFGWGLQLANMSAVYERLGARSDQVPLLWLAAPMPIPAIALILVVGVFAIFNTRNLIVHAPTQF